jgi:NAD(P)-dependent dehydrogenase (short-subunit alcohol dehydrogenase family)
MSEMSGRTTVVVGASRGLGRGIARAFAEAGAPVVAVARTDPAPAELATAGPNIRTEVADATRGGQTEEAYLQQLGELLTPEIAGSALVDLVLAGPATSAPGYVLTAAGPQGELP